MKALKLVESKKIALVELDKPQIGEGEALVKMTAVALNRRDQWIREGLYAGIQPAILGSDGCGIVEAVGSEKDSVWIGKKVVFNPNINWGENPEHQAVNYHILGMPSDGTFAEYLRIETHRLHEKPSVFSDEEAAALPLAGLTAYRAAFTHGGIREGKKVLITGAGGGVQQFAFQFALAAGAEVYATSGEENKMDVLKKMGAKAVFNYKEADWAKSAFKEAGSLFDVAIDCSGGETFATLVKLLGRSGRLVFYGATNGLPPSIDLYRMFFNQIRIQGSTMGNDEEFAQMLAFVTEKQIKPIISSVRPFDEIVAAFDEMKSGKHFGKLVVKF